LSSDNKLYEFGAFRLDSAERVLMRGKEVVVLPPKVFDTLLILVKKEGRVVSKSELMDAIWADAFVEDSNLSQNIYTLRRMLGIDEEGRQFIETVPRRGYRFRVPVKLLSDVSEKKTEQAKEKVLHDTTVNSNDNLAGHRFNATEFQPSTNNSQAIGYSDTSLISSSSVWSNVRPRPALHSVLFLSVGVLILFALVFGIYWFVINRSEKGESKIAPIEQLRFQRLTNIGDVVFPTISPNGELLAFVRIEEEEASVWVKQIATGNSVQTLPPSRKGYRSLAFSPDGVHLFFREEADGGAIYQTSAFGGTAKKIADNTWGDFSVSPDGKQLVFVRRDTVRDVHLLVLSKIDGSGERELSSRNTPMDYRGTPGWSPDGAKIVIAAGIQNQFPLKLLTVDVVTGKETELKTPYWRAISHTLWMPSGKHLIIAAREINESSSQLWMLSYPDGEVSRLTNDLEGYFWLSLSADGRMLVTRQQRIISHLWLLADAQIKKAKQLTFGERNFDGYFGLAWTPQDKILFSVFAGRNTDIYSMNADGINQVQLTENVGQDNTEPMASHDGRYIVFSSNRTGKKQIWRMDIDGRNQKQLTFDDEKNARAQSPMLSSDGTEVFFIRRGVGQTAIWKVSIEGGTPVQVSRLTNAAPEGFLSISPDGKWLAFRYVSTQPEAISEDRTLQIGVIPTDGSAEPKIFKLPMRRPIIQWTVDSTAFDFSAGTFNSSSLWRQPLNNSKPQKLIDFPDRIYNFAWSRDGKKLVVARGKQQGDAILITNLP